MQRRTVPLVLAVAMAGVCAGVVGMQSAVRADTPDSKAAKAAPPQIGWGMPVNGMQIGLFSQTEQRTFRYGDTFVLVMRVRNVSAAPIDLTVKAPVDLWLTLSEKGRIVLESLGQGREVPLHIAPGETLELPGIRYAAQIVAPGEKAGGMPNGAYALTLPPGEYHAECWLAPDSE